MLGVLLCGCEKTDSSVVDSFGIPPILVSSSITPGSVNLDTIPSGVTTLQFTTRARTSYPPGSMKPVQVLFTLANESGAQTLTNGELIDNGVFPDSIAGDSIFTARVTLTPGQLEVGKYYCRIVARDPNGYSSSEIFNPILVTRLNHIPYVFNVQAPDTISIGSQVQPLKLMVSAADTDGLANIVKVFFNTFKPDNSPSGGSPFTMYDDGISGGDAVRGDGIYTLTVANPSVTGTYRFEFQAVDRANELSQKIVHFIVVIP